MSAAARLPAIDEEFTVAAIGKKGKWYDHKVSVKNPVKEDGAEKKTVADLNLEDGDYTTEVTLEGGSGRKIKLIFLKMSD